MNRYIVILVVFLFPIILLGQLSIGGDSLNTYYSVVSKSGVNAITCNLSQDLSTLNPGDKVLLIQMTGAIFQSFDVKKNNFFNTGANNEGRYELLSVLSVNNTTKEVLFTANLKKNYTAGEKIQLVKVYETKDAIVTSTLSAPAWNPITGKGGILAMVILGKLTLNADIDLSGKGFRGADSMPYLIDCRPINAADTMYYIAGTLDRGGLKGEGIKSTTTNYTIGGGSNFNGGGGGFGKYGGGAGGSNYHLGGRGGLQASSCPSDPKQFAWGGYGLETGFFGSAVGPGGFYSSLSKITFGGGGGGSTYTSGRDATKGGDGGGIFILLADELDGNGKSININGKSVTTTATAGAGGGGGGGTLLLDVAKYTNTVNINLIGGKGGNTSGASDCGGAGGGGSGGVFLNASAIPDASISIADTGGLRGFSACGNDGADGLDGNSINNYTAIINGFTFNAITGIDTICYAQIPDSLIGTTPKGDSIYNFQWLESSDNSSWSITSVADTLIGFQPPALYNTTYYTRAVYFPNAGVRDTAISVKIVVYPDIVDNILTLRDTVCKGSSAGILSAKVVSGGDGLIYNYKWESSVDQTNWIVRSDGSTALFNETSTLFQDTYYRREVKSGSVAGVCVDTSNIDTITALDAIAGNDFLNPFIDTIICNSLQAGIILGAQTTGGDGSPYRYKWIRSINSGVYNQIPSAISKNYNPGILSTGDYSYKRIVMSGEGDACIDTTTLPRTVEVLAAITNNIIGSDSTRYCYADTPSELKQGTGVISGGKAGSYSYQWQQYNGVVWNNISGATSEEYQPGSLTDTSIYKRIVSSGLIGSIYACIDASLSLTIDVIPEITNNLVSADQTSCQEVQPLSFTESGASGGAGSGTFTYLWEESLDGTNWSLADGVRDQISYTAAILNVTTMYRRVATSQICALASDSIRVDLYDKITSNSILGSSEQYTCYNTSKALVGSQPQGGENNINFDYIWESSLDGISWKSESGSGKDFITPNLILSNYFRRVVQSGSEAECSDTSSVILTNINQLPTGDILSGIDTLCAGELIEINYSNLTGTSPWIIELGETTVLHKTDEISAASGTISFEIGDPAAIKVLSIQDDSSCFADTSANTGIINAMVYEIPVANPGENFEACGLDAQLNASLSTPGLGIWISEEGTFNNPSLPTAIVSMTSYGEKTLLWKEFNWECSDEAYINGVFYEQTLSIDAGEDQTLPYEFITNLEATDAASPAYGSWEFTQGVGILADSTLANTSVEMTAGLGSYVLHWTIYNGVCLPISDSLTITINDLELGNGFSPNGDDINDEYKLKFPGDNEVKFTILDRNGNVVNVISGKEDIVWDGTNEGGQQVPEDTYFYIIEEEGWAPRKGYIDIRR